MSFPKHAATRLMIAAALAVALNAAGAGHADLFEYVAKPDEAYEWELRKVEETPLGKVYDLHMVSQVWQGITWEHQVQVYEPRQVRVRDVVALYITGGGANEEAQLLGLTIANSVGARLATLYHIPNQPLFGDLSEDALISHTWLKYLETGDEDWILLFPMVKSALRAMDCLEELAGQRWEVKPRGFVVLGASKRGWTTYLTGIVAPERVLGIAPMVFDILNMAVQAQHQRDFWGDYSPQIGDYTEKNLEAIAETGRGFRLFWMVDPYTYRDRLLMPKLVILGSNDPYWPVDAVNYYWAGLPQPKLLLIAPDSGHDLDDRTRVLGSLAGFFGLVAGEQPLPRVVWRYDNTEEGVELHVVAEPEPAETRLWVARSEVRDFRNAEWEEAPLPAQGEELVAAIARAEGQYTAVYGEVVFEVDGRELYTSTQPRVLHPRVR
ncbi:MAG: PhoPQ-activated pathogenicity-related family protein [Armatimonadota bacterium]